MKPFKSLRKFKQNFALVLLGALPALASACASCGCSLSSDWENQGLSSGAGFSFDLRYDYLNQNQVRHGTGAVSSWPVAGQEQELYTKNHYVTAALDYSPNADWGINLQLPYIHRTHGTIEDGTGDTGSSKSSSMGDIKIIGRYLGFSEEKNIGMQFGMKLPTGSFKEKFSGGDLAGEALDRGLQPGTGTTDVIIGVFNFAPLSQNVDYFTQAIAQVPLSAREGYKTGPSLNANFGIRYLANEGYTPQLQINARVSGKDAGVNATPDDSGGKTIYLSPGVTFSVSEKIKIYGFFQLPVYQDLNGYQLAPRYTASIGTRFAF